MEVKIQKLRPGAVTPRRGSADAAGYDLSLDSDELGEDGCVEMIQRLLPLFCQ